MAKDKTTIPEDILKELQLKKPTSPAKEVRIVFDKGQAVVRIPTYFNQIIGIEEGDKFKVSLIENKGEKPTLKLEVVKK